MMRKSLLAVVALLLVVVPYFQQESIVRAAEMPTDSYWMYDIWDHWAETELTDLVNADIFKGYVDEEGDSFLDPGRNITRGQFAAIIVRALDLQATGSGREFSDVSSTHGLYDEIQIASDHNIALGKNGAFHPNQPITRAQLATMIVRAFADTVEFQGTSKTFNDVAAGYWAEAEIMLASSVNVIRGDKMNNFRPSENASRAHAAVMLHRALQLETSNLPADDVLKTIARNSELEAVAFLNPLNIDELKAHNERYYTGYEKAFVDEMIAMYEELGDEEQDLIFVGEPTVTVDKKSNRFAQVTFTSVVTVKYNDGTTKFETTMDYAPTMYMKFVADSWKIYYSDLAFDLEDLENLEDLEDSEY